MGDCFGRIDPLPVDVRAKVSSSCEVTTPEHAVEGLLRNALDANPRSILIVGDFAKGYISVYDDGDGIKEVEFSTTGHLAKLHCTNLSLAPAQNLTTPRLIQIGRRLAYLWTIRSLSLQSLILISVLHSFSASVRILCEPFDLTSRRRHLSAVTDAQRRGWSGKKRDKRRRS